jgi:hypothetical protein
VRAEDLSDDWDDDDDESQVIPVEKLTAAEQMSLLLENLDTGLVLTTLAGRTT